MVVEANHLLTSEVARICAVSSETVREWERSGRLSAEKTATGVRLFDPREVAALAEARRQQGHARASDVEELASAGAR